MDDSPDQLKTFLQLKKQSLSKKDLSLKGSIDELIKPLVDIINSNDSYYTTSTCSGRVTLIHKPLGNSGIKKGSKFLFSSHELVEFGQVLAVIESFIKRSQPDESCLWLKFEPFILHVQCSSLEKAADLLRVAIETNNRNSGMTIGKQDKFMVAVRSTSSMEVPVSGGSMFDNLDEKYLKFLFDECNRRMDENSSRLIKFQQGVNSLLDNNRRECSANV